MALLFHFIILYLWLALVEDKIDICKKKNKKKKKKQKCCKTKESERNKEETKREFRGNSDDVYFMLIKSTYRLIVRRPKAFT